MEPSEWKKATSTTMPANELKDPKERLEEILGGFEKRLRDLEDRMRRIEVLMSRSGLFSKQRLPEPQLKPEKTSKVRDILPIYEDSERR